MKKQKQIYVSPETETLVVRFEGSLMTYSGQNQKFTSSGTYDGDWEDED